MRYLKVTLVFGLLTCLVVLGLYEAGAFARADRALWEILGGLTEPPPARSWAQYLVVAFLAFGIPWTTVDIYKQSLKIVIAAGALLNVISATWVLNLFYVFFSPFPGIVTVGIGFTLGMLYGRSEAGGRKEKLRLLFGERVSRRTFYSLVNAKEPPQFDGQMREASVLVCEVFNHEDLMESLPVADYVAMTNLFLQSASEFLVERGGYLEECDGESLRVVFGAPLADERHAVTACEAAIELLRRLDNLNLESEARWHKTFDHRIGVNSGDVVAAAFGSGRLGTFSVAGEPAEFARRLCQANIRYGSRILIGIGALAGAGDNVEVRPMDLLRDRDDRAQLEVYELIGKKGGLTEDELRRRDMFWKGVIYFRERRWDEALDHFQAALPPHGTDAPAEYYLQRIQQLRTAGGPRPEWHVARA